MNFILTEKAIGYEFKNKELLRRALTLSSADAENNNQNLEFFGDAILEFLVSEAIYDEKLTEGELTERRKAIVSDSALAPVSQRLSLDKRLIKSVNDTSNKKAIPSVYEAMVAAIYLDGGIDCARKFVLSTLDFKPKKSEPNYKGELQEYLQSKGYGLPNYQREEIGTPQNPKFRVKVELFGKTFKGIAENAKKAEQLAAKAAYSFINSKR